MSNYRYWWSAKREDGIGHWVLYDNNGYWYYACQFSGLLAREAATKTLCPTYSRYARSKVTCVRCLANPHVP